MRPSASCDSEAVATLPSSNCTAAGACTDAALPWPCPARSSRCMPVAATVLASGSGELTVSSQRWNSRVPSLEVAQMVSQSAASASVAVCARAGSAAVNSSVSASSLKGPDGLAKPASPLADRLRL